MIRRVSDGIREIGEQMINNPEDWVQTDYEFMNVTNKDIRFWTANGMSFIKLNGNDSLSFVEKRYIVKSIKKSIANRLNAK